MIAFVECDDGLEGQAAHAVAEIIPAALAAKPGRTLGDIAILYRDYRAGDVVAEAAAAAGLDFLRVDTAAPYRKVALTSWIEDCAAWCAGGWREARPQLRGLLDRWIGFHRARISDAEASAELQNLTRLLWSIRVEEGLARDFVTALRAGILNMGGVQGVAAIANGLFGVKKADILVGPGNQYVAEAMVRLAPQRIRSLILYGTGPQGVLPGRFETIAQTRDRFLREGLTETVARIAATWFLDGEQAPGYTLCCSLSRKLGMQAALASLTAWQGWNGQDALTGIRARTLVLWGSHDQSYDWSQPETLWRTIPGADLAVVPGAAHNLHLEKPRLFNMLVKEFLAGLDPSSA